MPVRRCIELVEMAFISIEKSESKNLLPVRASTKNDNLNQRSALAKCTLLNMKFYLLVLLFAGRALSFELPDELRVLVEAGVLLRVLVLLLVLGVVARVVVVVLLLAAGLAVVPESLLFVGAVSRVVVVVVLESLLVLAAGLAVVPESLLLVGLVSRVVVPVP